MKHEFKTKDDLAQSRKGRKEELYVLALLLIRQNALDSFFAALRLCAKTVIVYGLGIVLTLFSGCAAANKWPSVERLNDGRQGFVITEKTTMDDGSRLDFERAVAHMNKGNYDRAIQLLTNVIGRSPGVSAPYIDLAVAYLRTDKPELAEQHLITALGLVPGHPAASNEYGLLLRKAGRFKEAREVYEKAIADFPDYLPARRNLGILCDLYLNYPACALEQFEIYSELMPADAQVKIWIAELRMRLGR